MNARRLAILLVLGAVVGVGCDSDGSASLDEPLVTATAPMAASDGDGSSRPTPTPDPTPQPTPTQTPGTPAPTPQPTVTACEPGTPLTHSTVTLVVRGDDGVAHEVEAEVVYTNQGRQTGLMHREEMAENAGMLFLFSSDRTGGFWMKNTLIPLDIAYIAADGTIVDIKRGQPCNREILTPQAPYRTVLEMNAGWFEDRGLGIGDTVELPDGLPTPQ